MKLSIIMPVYNSGQYLTTAVNSILSQDFMDYELILVDDGSTDGSSEKCDELATTDSRIRILHQKNQGICQARNNALKIARGEYIAFSDHDDSYLPTLLNTAYNVAIKNNADIVKYGVNERIIYGKNIIKNKNQKYDFVIYNCENFDNHFFHMLQYGVLNYVWDGLYKKDFIHKHNIKFDTSFKRGREDINFMLEILKHRPKLITIPQILYTHYIRKGFSTSSFINNRTKEDTFKTFSNLKTTMEVLKVDIDKVRIEYVFYIVKFFLNSNVSYLSKSWKKEPNLKLYNELEELYIAPFLPTFFFSINSCNILKYSKKYGLCYFLFKHKLWKLLLLMYYYREKRKSETFTDKRH